MEGQIVKIISNDYFVKTNNNEYICKARGKFRQENITPKVGDFCLFDEKEKGFLFRTNHFIICL